MAGNSRRRTTGFAGNSRRLTVDEQQARFMSAHRLFRLIGRLVGVVVIIAVGYWVTKLLLDNVGNSDWLKLQTINITGNRHLDEQEILKKSGLEKGRSIKEFDPAEIADKLKQDPWVENAIVNLTLPNTISVTIFEREPKAIISLEQLYLLDGKNQPFVAAPMTMVGKLPLITGLDRQFLTEHKIHADKVLSWGEKAVSLFAQEERFLDKKGLKVTEVNVSPITGVELELNKGLRLALGFDGSGENSYAAKLQRAYKTLNVLEKRGQRARAIFLDNNKHPQYVYVKLAKKS